MKEYPHTRAGRASRQGSKETSKSLYPEGQNHNEKKRKVMSVVSSDTSSTYPKSVYNQKARIGSAYLYNPI